MSRRKIEVVAYNPDWAKMFIDEKTALGALLENIAVSIEHIGSTSVDGLCAKPIIDMLVEVASLKALDDKSKALEAIGYEVKGENGIVGRRYFQKGGDDRTHHLHAFLSGDENLLRHRAFKDYLIAHPDIALEYAAIKQQAAQGCNNDSRMYMSLKNDFIEKHERLAVMWYDN